MLNSVSMVLSSAGLMEKIAAFPLLRDGKKFYDATRKIFLSLKSPMRLFFFNLVASDKIINFHS